MRYLITGGAGFIGSALARRMLEEGHRVRVLDDMSRGRAERVPDGCEVVAADIRDAEATSEAVHGCDAVAHLAYVQGTQTFYAEPRLVLDIAARGMLNVLSACERWGVGDLLLLSSSEAYQIPPSAPTPETVPLSVPDVLNPRYSYGGGKIACELMAFAWQRAGVLDRAAVARPHNIYGPDGGREHVIPEFALRMAALERGGARLSPSPSPFPIQGSGKETRSFCHIDDCVDQLSLVLRRAEPGCSVYHVGTMDERTIESVAHSTAACLDMRVEVVPGALPQGSPPRRLPDTSKVEALGHTQSVSFEDGLAATVEWYRRHG